MIPAGGTAPGCRSAVTSLQAKRAALDKLSVTRPETNSDTKQSKSEKQLPQVIENMADPERLELPTSAFEAHCSIHLSYGSTPRRG